MAASALAAADIEDLIQRDAQGYRTLAIRLATDRSLLQATRERIKRARHGSSLFDSARRVRELEAAYRAMHERALRGESPVSFDVAG